MNLIRKKPVAAVIRERAGSGIALGIAVALAAVAFVYATQAKYRADADFLIVETQSEGKDFYTLFKSSEYLGNVLANAVGSERFIDAVIESGALNAKSLPADKGDRLKAWNRMVTVKKSLDLGVLSVSVKADSDRDAARIASGVAQVLMEKNSLFRSGDEKGIEIRTLSGPIIESNLGTAKLAAAALAGFLAGFLIVVFSAVIKNETVSRQPEYPSA